MNIKTFVGSILVLLIFIAPAYSQAIKNAVPDVARPLPLSSVRITGGPLKRAQDLDADYLLKLEPDRMMAYYRKRAGLEPRAKGYPGWDGDGKNLTGHIAGHYLSGVSLMFAATGDPRFKQRADYIVKKMKEVQDKNGDGIYYESGDRLWINMYVSSTATWKEAGATLKITLQKPNTFTLFLRRPSWAGEGFTVKVNNKSETALSDPGSYVELKRTWKTGDTVSLVLPKALHIEGLPDNQDRAASMWGPLVLAGDLGPEQRGGLTASVPGLVTDEKPVTEWLQPVPDSLGVFRTVGVGRNSEGETKEIAFSPFYRLHRRTYAVYWDLYNRDEWTKKIAELTTERVKQQRLETATVAFLQPGEAEKEKAFNLRGEETEADRVLGRAGRRARKWFSFDLPVESGKPLALVVTYNPEERAKRTFEILVDGQRIGEGIIERFPPGSPTGKFYDLDYKIPAELVAEKKKVTVRFQSTAGNETATIFGVRIVRAD